MSKSWTTPACTWNCYFYVNPYQHLHGPTSYHIMCFRVWSMAWYKSIVLLSKYKWMSSNRVFDNLRKMWTFCRLSRHLLHTCLQKNLSCKTVLLLSNTLLCNYENSQGVRPKFFIVSLKLPQRATCWKFHYLIFT